MSNNIEINISSLTGKPYMYEEDFIDKYKDSNNKDIQYLINGLIHGYLSEIINIIKIYKEYLYYLAIDNNYKYNINEYYTMRKYIEFNVIRIQIEFDLSKNKKDMWKYIDHDIDYYWNQIDDFDLSINKAIDLDFIFEAYKKGEEKCIP